MIHLGGVENNSLTNILEIDTNENLNSDQPQLIHHSPYYNNNKLFSTLIKIKNEFSILSTNIVYKCNN